MIIDNGRRATQRERTARWSQCRSFASQLRTCTRYPGTPWYIFSWYFHQPVSLHSSPNNTVIVIITNVIIIKMVTTRLEQLAQKAGQQHRTRSIRSTRPLKTVLSLTAGAQQKRQLLYRFMYSEFGFFMKYSLFHEILSKMKSSIKFCSRQNDA